LVRIEAELGCPVLAFVTGDRPGLQTQIATEQLVRFPRHLAAIGDVDTLALLLYTQGGETHAAWPLVSFLREHCETLVVLVPFWAHSCGTLITLGADRILMTRYATLSPIDPSVANPFNPQDPANPQARIPIAVEDVMAYLELVEKHSEAGSTYRQEAFARLTQGVHPLALGNVQRSINQIRQLAEKMIALHSPDKSSEETAELVRRLTSALHSHFHLVSRREAREIGLPVEDPTPKLEELLLGYYAVLRDDLLLLEKFDPGELLRSAAASEQGPSAAGAVPATTQPAQTLPVSVERGYIETTSTCDSYVTEGVLSRQQGVRQMQMPGMPGLPAPQVVPVALPSAVAFEVVSEGWRQIS
jgi:hypothetical protein